VRNQDLKKKARALGGISVGLGLAEVVAPEANG
jgi:hypothetical protein